MLRLVVVEGEDQGEVFVSEADSIDVGAGPGNDFRLADPYVSRRHGRLSLAEGQWHYTDLGSKNGSAVARGGARVAVGGANPEVVLRPGDILCLGKTRLRFEVEEPSAPGAIASRGWTDVSAAEARRLGSREGATAAYHFERQLGLAFDPEQALDAILTGILAEFPQATHALLVLLDRETKQPRRQVARVRGEAASVREGVPLSLSLAARVLREGRSVLFRDVAGQFADSASAMAAGITSAMCAPLWTGEETVGLIQVDCRAGGAPFTEDDLDHFGLLAHRAALAVVGSELRDREHRSRLWRDLSAMVAHDLKTPLVGLQGYLDLLARERLAEKPRALVEAASSLGTWLFVLVAGILDVARMEAGQVTLVPEALDIGAEFQAALALIGYQLRDKGIRSEVSLGAALPRVAADRALIRRTITNLIANAVRFAPRGSVLWLGACAADEGESVVISVRDEGPGIPRQQQARLFDKFAQVAAGPQAEQVSVGLGLAFCRLAAEAHGGRIWCESESGQGACFSFSLPVEAA